MRQNTVLSIESLGKGGRGQNEQAGYHHGRQSDHKLGPVLQHPVGKEEHQDSIDDNPSGKGNCRTLNPQAFGEHPDCGHI